MNLHSLLGSYIARLYAAETLETRFQVYEKYLKQLGFDGATYLFAARAPMEARCQHPCGIPAHYRLPNAISRTLQYGTTRPVRLHH